MGQHNKIGGILSEQTSQITTSLFIFKLYRVVNPYFGFIDVNFFCCASFLLLLTRVQLLNDCLGRVGNFFSSGLKTQEPYLSQINSAISAHQAAKVMYYSLLLSV